DPFGPPEAEKVPRPSRTSPLRTRARPRSGSCIMETMLQPLLELYRGAGFFKLLLEVLGVFLRRAFLDGGRSAFHRVLRLLEAEAGDGAHGLDDRHLVGTEARHDDVELGFLLGSSLGLAPASARRGNRHRRGGGYA